MSCLQLLLNLLVCYYEPLHIQCFNAHFILRNSSSIIIFQVYKFMPKNKPVITCQCGQGSHLHAPLIPVLLAEVFRLACCRVAGYLVVRDACASPRNTLMMLLLFVKIYIQRTREVHYTYKLETVNDCLITAE